MAYWFVVSRQAREQHFLAWSVAVNATARSPRARRGRAKNKPDRRIRKPQHVQTSQKRHNREPTRLWSVWAETSLRSPSVRNIVSGASAPSPGTDIALIRLTYRHRRYCGVMSDDCLVKYNINIMASDAIRMNRYLLLRHICP